MVLAPFGLPAFRLGPRDSRLMVLFETTSRASGMQLCKTLGVTAFYNEFLPCWHLSESNLRLIAKISSVPDEDL